MSDVEPAELLRQRLREHGLEASSVRPARSGLEHHLFHVVLSDGAVRLGKVPKGQMTLDPHWPDRTSIAGLRAEAEAIALGQAKLRGTPQLPEPYLLMEGDLPAALMGVIPGVPPEESLLKRGMDHRTLRAVCVEMGRMLAELHRVKKPTDAPTVIPDLPGQDCSDPRLLHMDFHLGNVLGNFQLGQGWRLNGVCDWTSAHWGPREADVGELGASLFATNPDLLDDFLMGYRQRSGIVLNYSRVLDVLVSELERRLRDDPPDEPRIKNAWYARVEEWSRQI
ncbi:MAG: aminoglycoside phosphotransferase family protein [Alphaproteobacteria bacterium]|nr:aminoglycoside phosphotransferase family protein [Alphaproteobacteria bacterium]